MSSRGVCAFRCGHHAAILEKLTRSRKKSKKLPSYRVPVCEGGDAAARAGEGGGANDSAQGKPAGWCAATLGFVRDWVSVDWGAGGAPRVCVSEVMLRRAWAARVGEGVRPHHSGWLGKT